MDCSTRLSAVPWTAQASFIEFSGPRFLIFQVKVEVSLRLAGASLSLLAEPLGSCTGQRLGSVTLCEGRRLQNSSFRISVGLIEPWMERRPACECGGLTEVESGC